MSFLLKIVQGPNAGAEIALAEGVNVSFGSGDECDIILSDSSLPERAFELETTVERVVAVMPGGKSVKLEPFHVTLIGTTAVVVGPQEGTWKSLVWPKPDKADEPVDTARTEESPREEKPGRKRRSYGCLAVFLFLVLVASIAGYFYWKYPDKTVEYSEKTVASLRNLWQKTAEKVKSMKSDDPVPVQSESLEAVAADCGFTVAVSSEGKTAKGDFKTRVERLEATARAYAAQPGLKVDFTDAESLSSAVSEFLFLVTDGRMKLDKIEGRKAFLSGTVASKAALDKILRSLSDDVSKISSVDCSGVAVSLAEVSSTPGDAVDSESSPRPTSEYKTPKLKKNPRAAASTDQDRAGRMPIVGVMTVPYPCLVLSDGTRAMEGARFGEYVIEKIEADRVTVRGGEGSFEWRP